MNRRTLLASAGTVSFMGLAGCLGLTGLDEHSSEPGGVEQSVLEETEYESVGIEEIVVEEEVDLVLYEESVSVTNQLTEYEKSVDMGPLGDRRGAVFLVLTTPQVSVFGREFNPVEEMDAQELVELVEDNYDDISNISREEDDTITILDQETVQSRFSADARFDGQDVDVYLHVTEAIESNDDHLVAIGVYPEPVRIEEEENVLTLMERVIEEFDETDGGASPTESGDESNGDSQEDDMVNDDAVDL